MVFQAYDPREGKRLALLSPDGCLAESASPLPHPSDAEVLDAYQVMVLARQADEWAVNLNRQGRMPTYVLNQGQEANSAGALLALRPDNWFVPAYRELAGMLMRGQPLHVVGLAYAERFRRTDRVVIAFIGEGAISEGAAPGVRSPGAGRHVCGGLLRRFMELAERPQELLLL